MRTFVALAALMLAGNVFAKDIPDKGFMEKAARSAQMEVQMGRLAEQHATSPGVKQFAQRLVQDHQKAQQQLQTLASARGLQLKQEEDKGHQGKLAKKQGAEFDKEFVKEAVKEHRKDVKTFEKEAKKAKDPEVRAWAEQTLPVLQEHLQIAERLEKEIGK